jgi:hypothetical protein
LDGRENLAGTLAFSRFVLKDIFRNRGRTFSSIIGVVLAVSLIAGENIALDTTARDVLTGELEDYHIDLYGSTNEEFTTKDLTNLSEELVSVYGVEDVLPMSHMRVELEVHNESTIVPPKYGYSEKNIDVDIPANGSVWLNVTLEQIPLETYRLYGYVYSQQNGEPVENVLVIVQEGTPWLISFKDSMYTDEQGYYEFDLPEAEYRISLSLEDYSPSLYYSEIYIYLSGDINITASLPEKQLDFYIPDVESSTLQGYIIDSNTSSQYNGSIWLEIRNSTEISNYKMNFFLYHYTENGSFLINTIPGNLTIDGVSDDGEIKVTQVEVESNVGRVCI